MGLMRTDGTWTSRAPAPRGRWLAVGALGVTALLGAACSSNSASPTTTTTAASTTAPASTGATVSIAHVGSLGPILVDSSGMTLYRYTPDGTGSPTCTGACATAWPPLTVTSGTGHVTGGSGIATGELATAQGANGTLQVTYKGMPLYRYSGDSKSGDATGQGIGGVWFVIPVATTAVATTTTVRASSGY